MKTRGESNTSPQMFHPEGTKGASANIQIHETKLREVKKRLAANVLVLDRRRIDGVSKQF